MLSTLVEMILELDLPEVDHIDLVGHIHEFLEPAKRHIENGGTVVLTKKGRQIGVAETVEELFRLAIG